MKKLSYKEILGIVILILVVVLILNFGIKNNSSSQNNLNSGGESVSAQDIYPLFICPCCGRPIDTGCCGMAKERKAYVDGLVQGSLSEEKVIMAYVEKYGLDSFKDKDKKQEFKEKLVKEAPVDRPQIVIEPSFLDLGNVSQKDGITTTIFELKNEGNKDLLINRLETSCGCTSASIVYQDKEGPKFSMPGHGTNEEIQDWQVLIPPKEKAQLKVYYDPDVHPDFRGTAVREIYVFSNDPIEFETKVKIELNQVD